MLHRDLVCSRDKALFAEANLEALSLVEEVEQLAQVVLPNLGVVQPMTPAEAIELRKLSLDQNADLMNSLVWNIQVCPQWPRVILCSSQHPFDNRRLIDPNGLYLTDRDSPERPVQTWMSLVIFLAVLGYWLHTIIYRIDYPYDLEWMEGGMLIHAWRIQQDLGIYVLPSSDFIPYIYPPLYPTVLAWLSECWTLDYWMGKGVSIFGSLLATSALIVGVRRETASWSLSWLAGALWLSTYEDSGTFMDLTRADGLMMGLLGLVAGPHQRLDKPKLAGGMLWLAFLAKHNAAIVSLPIALWLWRESGLRQAWTFSLSAAVPALISIGWLQYQTEGLFLTYLLDVPASSPIVGYRLF